MLFSYLRNDIPAPLLKILLRAAEQGSSAPFLEMDPGSKLNFSLCWGNNQGYTFSSWVYFYPNNQKT